MLFSVHWALILSQCQLWLVQCSADWALARGEKQNRVAVSVQQTLTWNSFYLSTIKLKMIVFNKEH